MNLRRSTFLTLALLPFGGVALSQEEGGGKPETLWGHSSHGSAYDVGPRQKPWMMEGIGEVSFPITSAHPEVQAWFDQAIALMHGFWWYEAERSLRWCIKLDPECAMAYWALANIPEKGGGERSGEFLDRALELKGNASQREQDYIDVAAAFREADDASGKDEKRRAQREAMEQLDRLLMDYPEDVEAKALYWLIAGQGFGPDQAGKNRYALESVLDDILEEDSDHPGALHYRVHNWDGKDGAYVVDTCMRLPEIAPNCGHLLHMPGHVLSGIGLWHEAAIAMDRATRVEKAYMNERMVMPEDNWDYVHNLDYLCYIQEQLGMVDQALLGAEQLLKAPAFTDAPFFASLVKGPTIRALTKFQRWDELLQPGRLSFDPKNPIEMMTAGPIRVRALIGLGQVEEAEAAFEKMQEGMAKAMAEGPGGPGGSARPGPGAGDEEEDEQAAFFADMMKKQMEARVSSLEGMLLVAKGEHLEGLAMLTKAAEVQEDGWMNDPPRDGEYLFNFLGDTYLELGAPKLAVECYERTLETIFHDGFALAGLVVAHAQLGETEKATAAMAKLGVVWSDADRPNRWLEAAEATGITAEPHLDAPVQQRNYKREVLDRFGPSLWIPSDVPELTALNAAGEKVHLADYDGQNVVLIFYLGEECVHCIEQLQVAEEHIEGLSERDAVVLAVSRDTVERIAEQQEDFGVTLLSDVDFTNARRFQSYDDFEEIELHSTFIIDREGRLHWSTIGGEPFTNFEYIEAELDRLNEGEEPRVAVGEPVRADEVAAGPAAR